MKTILAILASLLPVIAHAHAQFFPHAHPHAIFDLLDDFLLTGVWMGIWTGIGYGAFKAFRFFSKQHG